MERLGTYIFRYVAKLHGNGTLRGRIEATSALHAKQRVMQSNELIKDAHISSLLKNQASARKNAFEAMEEFI
ncbi:hypothetical protein [Acinetobacter baumannii]|uniref:hypothetical protein n=1 Tax=Acinetobacter baumannii TaxID=470 RepID=UPI00259E4F31|nr:hypothetical protein [Acinetobacter baumannii]EKU6482291.1 hypothetical protein [Acinetobacter baumannii]EKV9818649.1 hypothetical protein [Acinetobacter baumannii]EKW0126456.1 hypothetical protein [Acinetobacter baumannii]EKW0465080.1 hypothetical protein [Acinetobacter baumannii]